MKVMIKHACGCEKENVISGKIEGREYRIARLEERKCYDCWTKEQAEKETGKVEIVEMHYSEYKNSNYKAVPDSYDRKTKTIKVYVPVATEKEEVEVEEAIMEEDKNLTPAQKVINEIKRDIISKMEDHKGYKRVFLTNDDMHKYNDYADERGKEIGAIKKDMIKEINKMMVETFDITKDFNNKRILLILR